MRKLYFSHLKGSLVFELCRILSYLYRAIVDRKDQFALKTIGNSSQLIVELVASTFRTFDLELNFFLIAIYIMSCSSGS